LVAPRCRAAPATTAPGPAAAVPNVRAHRPPAVAGPVLGLLPALVSAQPRGRLAPLPDVRTRRPGTPPRPMPRLLHVLVPAWPRPSRRAVAARLDPPDGYVVVTCPGGSADYPDGPSATPAWAARSVCGPRT